MNVTITKTSEITREAPSAHLQFVGKILMQLWEVEYAEKHYKDGQYTHTSYRTEEVWRAVEGQNHF